MLCIRQYHAVTDMAAVLVAAAWVYLVKVLAVPQLARILLDRVLSRAVEAALLELMGLTVEKTPMPNHAKELVVLMAAGLVVAIINEELMVPCVLCGPDAHAPSHQLVLEHLNFLEIT